MEIRYTKDAVKALTRMPTHTAKRIRDKIEQYAADPDSLAANVKKLQARDGYRLRVGDYRVIFEKQGTAMDVLQIGPRGSIYED
jgi:mRNA interferase RelE/StbE